MCAWAAEENYLILIFTSTVRRVPSVFGVLSFLNKKKENNVLVYDMCSNDCLDNAMNKNVKAMWSDPRFQLLADLDRLLDSNKIWGGMEWVYHPIHPAKYRPMAERVRTELGKLYAEYGVEE